jgi:SDR family mycofactocin-dependent oxidoreductase
MANFEGKVAFITGVARGQGRSHAIELARAGVNIIGLDLCGDVGSAAYAGSTEADLARTAKLIEVAGGRIVAEPADVRIYAQVESALRKGLAEFGRLDFVVANAGIFAAGRSWEIPLDAWREMIDINLTGVWHTTRAAIPSLIEGGRGGSIVITGSIDALKAMANTSSYASAKHGLVGLMKSLANELGEFGIRVNSVNPTQVDTDMIQNPAVYKLFRPDLTDPSRDQVVDAFAATNVLPVPWIEPKDVSNAVMWLLSDEARYVTGAALTVDAGYTIK